MIQQLFHFFNYKATLKINFYCGPIILYNWRGLSSLQNDPKILTLREETNVILQYKLLAAILCAVYSVIQQ